MKKETAVNKVLYDFRKGKITAYEKLFKLFYPKIFKYAHHFLGDPFEAEDLVQEVFIQVWDRRKTFINEKQFASYLFSMVRNKCLNILKRKVIEEKYLATQARLKSEELYLISFGVDDDFVSMEEKLCRVIEDVMSEMPERCREAFRLKWTQGKKNREIAEIMGISTTMVDKHLAKGFEIAREKIPPALMLLFFKILFFWGW